MGNTEAQSSEGTCPLNIASKGHSKVESGSIVGLGEKGLNTRETYMKG